jgi:hypothetical protein
MTSATALAAPTLVRPPHGGLLWVVWRRHRAGLAATVLLLGGCAVFLLVTGLAMHADAGRLGVTSCGDPNGPGCALPVQLFTTDYGGLAMYTPRFLEFLPAALGVFLGAPLVARELESGTFRFAWTQGRTRTRLLAAELAALVAVVAVLCLAFAQLFAWWFRPWEPIMGRMIAGQAYEVEGLVFAARAVFGVLLGALLGALIRRTVPAMAATAAVWLAVAWPSVLWLRPLLATPVSLPANSPAVDITTKWVTADWFQDGAGRHVSTRALETLALQSRQSGQPLDFSRWLGQHGYTEWVSFQPASRFWHFQLVEAGCYVVLAAALGAAAVHWVRRHAA